MNNKQMIESLMAHTDYGGWNHPYRRWSPIAWNIKVHFDYDETGHSGGGEPVDKRFDDAWQKYVTSHPGVWDEVLECAQRDLGIFPEYVGKNLPNFFEYSSDPGDDQGDYQFAYGGRSGGWLILAQWKSYDFLRMESRGDFEETLEEMAENGDLKEFYRVVQGMDNDFSKPKQKEAINYAFNWVRSQWEEELTEQERQKALGLAQPYLAGTAMS